MPIDLKKLCGDFSTSNINGYAKVDVFNISGYVPKECEIKVNAIKVLGLAFTYSLKEKRNDIKGFVEELYRRYNYVLLIPNNANSDVKSFFESAYEVLGTQDPFEVTKNLALGFSWHGNTIWTLLTIYEGHGHYSTFTVYYPFIIHILKGE